MIPHTVLFHVLGLTNGSGPWYLFWSGIFSDATIFGGACALMLQHNCHVKGCWRLGRHMVGPHRVCRKHHPDDAPSAQDIVDTHRSISVHRDTAHAPAGD